MERRQLLLMAVVVEGGAVLLAWALGAVLSTPPFGNLHLTGRAAAYGVLASLPLLAGMAWVWHTRWPPLVRLRRTVEDITHLFADCTLLDLALIAALAGIGEEALFRGVMQPALTAAAGLWTAIALTSLVFGLAHFVSFTYAVYAALVSVYLGVLLVAFDTLLVPMAAHAAYDFAALVYLVRTHAPGRTGDGLEGAS